MRINPAPTSEDLETLVIEQTLEDWVEGKCKEWRTFYSANYQSKHEEYDRLWRGIWASEDKTRDSERCKLIAPALQQAVESAVAEVEEATFGRGKWFEMRDDANDPEKEDVVATRDLLLEDFNDAKVRKAVGEILINAAVTGTGIGEIVLETVKRHRPASQEVMDGAMIAGGVETKEVIRVKLVPVNRNNFLIDPVATCVDDALGCAIERYVPTHSVTQLQESGVYRECSIGTAVSETDLLPDQNLDVEGTDKVKLVKYYGLVPRELLEEAMNELEEDENYVSLRDLEGGESEEEERDESEYVEALVVLGNGKLLKAEANPFMMEDRPIVAFQWDIVPGRFDGRGVCEKGYNSQKALDAEMRARVDALALAIHPMMAIDSTRIPRGHKPTIRPGKTLYTVGNPNETLMPFNFGQVSQITFAQSAELQKMVQQATGAVDSAGIAGNINGEATAAGISMSLGALIKRHKRTLLNFQEGMLSEFVKKAAYRYMQYDPERYRSKDYSFIISGTLGIIAREYEVSQLVQLLQTMSPDSPIYSALIEGIIDNMALSKREELLARIKASQEPSEEDQKKAEQQYDLDVQLKQAQIAAFAGQGKESEARGVKYTAEANAVPAMTKIRQIEAITTNLKSGEADDKEFSKRMSLADRILKNRELDIKDRDSKTRRGQAIGNRASQLEKTMSSTLSAAAQPQPPQG